MRQTTINRRAAAVAGALSAAVTAVVLCSCGGGTSPSAGRGAFLLTVNWPAPASGRLVPAASASISAVLTRGSASLGNKLLVRPSQPPWTTSVRFDGLAAGDVTLTATAYPNADGSGTAQATGAATATIASNQTTSVTVTMASTIDHVTITPANPTVNVGATQALTATAYDAAGSVVLVAAANLAWTPTTSGNATVSPATGATTTATGVTAGTQQVTVKEAESGKSGSTTVTVAMPAGGCTPGTVTGPGGLAAGAPWPKSMADVRNTGRGAAGATGTLVWHASLGAQGGFQVAVGPDGTIYTGTYAVSQTQGGKIVAQNPSDGSVKWTFQIPDTGGVYSTPALGRNGILYVSYSMGIFALNAQTGAVVWSQTGQDPRFLKTSPTIGADGTVYIGGGAGLNAYDPNTGAAKWSSPISATTGWYWTSPAIGSDGTLYTGGVGSSGNADSLFAIDGKAGCIRWAAQTGEVGGVAIGDDGTLYATAGAVNNNVPDHVIAVDPATGHIKWTAANVPGAAAPPAIGPDGTVYVLSTAAQLTAVNPTTGAVKWTAVASTVGQNRASPAVAADNSVYFIQSDNGSNNGGRLVAVNGATGAVKWEYPFGTAFSGGGRDATPSIASDGTVYVRNWIDGSIYAVR